MDAPFQIGSLDLKPNELEKLKALALSHAFQSNLRGLGFPLYVTAAELGDLNSGTKPTPYSFRPIAIEDLWRRTQQLTLSEKANETLRNLADTEPFPGFNHRLALRFDLESDPTEPTQGFDPESSARSLKGLAFAAVPGEATVVFELLRDEGLITLKAKFDYSVGNPVEGQTWSNKVRITPRGYALIERLRKGDLGLTRTAFLICRFIKDLDKLYIKIYKPVGESDDVRCPVLRMKDIHHVDKIDDRILREIEQATVVLVDLTDQNFNVAFEAGYALALRKPIVWTLRAPMPDKLPFDIQSHNILLYDPAKPSEFGESLKYRILAALGKASAGGRP